MATGNASYSSIPPTSFISTPPQNHSGQTVQIGNGRYIIAANQPHYDQPHYDQPHYDQQHYISGMSG